MQADWRDLSTFENPKSQQMLLTEKQVKKDR